MKTTCKSEKQREVEKNIVIVESLFPRKMVSSSTAKAPLTKDTNQRKQAVVKPPKTRAQKDAHNASCKRSRRKKETQNNKMRKDIGRMKKEQEDKIYALQCMQNEIQKMRRALEEQEATEARMSKFITSLEIEGQSFSSSEQVCQLCPDNTNITASDPRLSFVANNIAFDAPNSNLSYPAAGLLDSGAGSSFHSNDDDCLSDWIMEMLKPDAAAGLLDSGAGSSHANDDDCLSAWIKEMSKPDAAAGISETKNLVVENQNNEMVNQIDHDAMVHRRELSPAQRGAENERDRQHMPEYNLELERPRNVETEYEEIAPVSGESQLWLRKVGNTISQFAEESKRINDIDPYLARKIQEVDNIVRQHVLLL